MSFNYPKTAENSLKLLTRFGQTVTQRKITQGVYDPATGANTITYTDTTRKAVMLDFGKGMTQVNGTLIQQGDKQLLVDADADIEMQHKFIVGNIEWSIVSIGKVAPAGVAVLYDLHVRAG
jgi:hypothetical protein